MEIQEWLGSHRAGNLERLCLCTFDGDAGLLAFYRRQGFALRDSRPIGPHPTISATGNFVLMVRELAG